MPRTPMLPLRLFACVTRVFRRRILPLCALAVLLAVPQSVRADSSMPVAPAARAASAADAPLVGPGGLGASSQSTIGTKRLITLPLAILAPGEFLPDEQGTNDKARFAQLMQGLQFGMAPKAVNALLPEPFDSAAWDILPVTHYFGPTPVRYFWVGLNASGPLKSQVTSCFGLPSYIAFYFEDHKLFLVSYRFATDPICPRTVDAADDIFGLATILPRNLIFAEHYRTLNVDVVDLWQPGVLPVVHRRWQAEAR